MAIPPNSLFVRVRHLGNSQGSIYLNDIDTYLNRYQESKIPVYVPFEESIDIPLVDEVLISYNRGSLYKHSKNNLIEVLIFSEKNVAEVTNVTEYQILLESDIVLVDTSAGDVTVTLPEMSFLPDGREVIVKKSTEDTNQLIIRSVVPDLIDRNFTEVATTKEFGAYEFRTAAQGWWLISEYPSTAVSGEPVPGDGENRIIFFPTQEEVFVINTENTTSIQLAANPLPSELVIWNGVVLTKGTNHDYTLVDDTITFTNDISLSIGDVIKVLYNLETDEGISSGSSLVWKGEWDGDVAYTTDDLVSYEGSTFIAVADTTGNQPDNSLEWELFASKGADGFIGQDGLSAYEIAVNEGFVGTEAEWLDSLQGADGPQGPVGEDGTSFTWVGEWFEGTSYLVNDVVSYQGSSYIAVTNTLGTIPDTSVDWNLVAAKGDDGTGGTGETKVYPHLAKRDSTNPSLVYVGTATADGSNENDPVWQIYRQNIENTNEPRQYAGNTEDFIHIWDQRESLSYGA